MARKYNPTFQAPPSYLNAVAVSLASVDFAPTYPILGVLCGGTAGTIAVDTLGSERQAGNVNVTITLAAGQLLPLSITKIYKTGTTATLLVALS